MMKGLGLLAAVLLVALALGRSVFRTRTTGSPWGPSARVGDTVVTLITRLEPYLPTLNRKGGDDRYSMGLLIHSARDGSVRRFIKVSEGQRGSNLNQTEITGTDGKRVWFRAPEPAGYDVATGKVVPDPEAGQRPSKPFTMADLATGDDALLLFMTAGGFPTPDRWLGVLSDAEAKGSFKPGLSISPDYPLERSREPRHLVATAVDRTGDGKPRVRQLEPLGTDSMLNAGFLRVSRGGEILRLLGDGYLLIYESKPYRAGTIIARRIDFGGRVVWTLDTGIGTLREILPDPETPALIGERPRIPDKLSEPILVVIDAATGRVTTHSLWMQ